MANGNKRLIVLVCTMMFLVNGCAQETRVNDSPGRATIYEDPTTVGAVQGVGTESQDIISMADLMMRDIINAGFLARSTRPPLVVIDEHHFQNRSSSRLDLRLITDKLRVNLARAAQGRMHFVGREHIEMVEKERLLKREGVVTAGTLDTSPATAGVDYRLTGTITSLDAVDNRGTTSRYHQFTFELINMETGLIVWSNIYDFRKSARDDVIYR